MGATRIELAYDAVPKTAASPMGYTPVKLVLLGEVESPSPPSEGGILSVKLQEYEYSPKEI